MVDATVHLIERGNVRADAGHVVEGFGMATASEPEPEPMRGAGPVYNLVIDHPEATILWDTGSHPEAGDGHWPDALYDRFEHYDAGEHRLPDQLEAAGFGIEDVDAVIATHLHLDHAGGLYHFDGTDVPVYVHEEELKQAYYLAKTEEFRSPYVAADFDHDLNWQVLHQNRESHFEGVEFIRFPGHTPGLTGTMVHLEDETVVFAGDEMYRAENYEEEIPLGANLLWGKRAWFDSMQHIKELSRVHDAQVVFGHDADQFEEIADGWG